MARTRQLLWLFATVTFLTFLSGCSGGGSTNTSAPNLVSIQVTSASSSIAKGSEQQFNATANYSDNTTQDFTSKVTWISSNTSVATISNSGLATSVAVGGPVTIVATFGGMSGTATLTSTAATLVSIQVTPSVHSIAQGTTQQFTAIGNFSDNTTQDLTTTVLWTSSNTAVASINSASGVATGVSTGGPISITANHSGVSGTANLEVTAATLISIQVTPATPSIAKSTTQQFTAIGNYSDNTTQDLTTTALWSSSNISVASISASGIATGVQDGGPVTITASFGGKSGTASLTITAATLTSIQVTPSTLSIAKGTGQQLTAIGTYSDNTTQNLTTIASWVSSNSTIARVSTSFTMGTVHFGGVAAGVTVGGPVTITATFGGVSGTTSLSVTPATLSYISVDDITPAGWRIDNIFFIGYPRQFTAIGKFSDGTTQDFTTTASWASNNLAIASIDSGGLATGVGVGSVNLSATFGGVTSTVNFAVDIVKLISVTVPTLTFSAGETWQYKLYGRFNNLLNQYTDYASEATWSSDDPAIASVSASGVVTGNAAGSTAIRASYAGLSDWGLVTILPPPSTPPPTSSCGGVPGKICIIAY